jgi:hypothetical protein
MYVCTKFGRTKLVRQSLVGQSMITHNLIRKSLVGQDILGQFYDGEKVLQIKTRWPLKHIFFSKKNRASASRRKLIKKCNCNLARKNEKLVCDKKTSWNLSKAREFVLIDQCDQIGQNFAVWVHFF